MLTFARNANDAEIASIYDASEIADICASIEEFRQSLEYSSEGMLTSTLDFFGKIMNTLSVSITRFYKSVKRGELEKYCHDHMATVRKIEGLNIDNPAFDVEIDLPSEMKASYKDATNLLSQIFNDLDLKEMLVAVRSALQNLSVQINREKDITVQVGSLAAITNAKKQFVARSAGQMESYFTGGEYTTRKFKEEFTSVGEFRMVKEHLIACEKKLDQVNSIHKLTDDITAIISDIESKKMISIVANSAKQLSDAAEVLAKTIDLFGMSIMNLLAVSHNYTLIYNKIAKKV